MKSSFAAQRGLGSRSTGRRALLGLLAMTGLAGSALATDGRNPASLLLYPEFDNRTGTATVITVTNVQVGDQQPDVRVEFVYIGRFGPKGGQIDCEETNRTVTLTPGDTFTALTNVHNPEHEQGFVYAFAKNNLDMNGCEYSTNPDEILIPRFFGQQQTNFVDELIMIGLSGGAKFETKIDFLIFNDNEEIFSSEHTFRCWERTPLLRISNLFANDFLKNWTNDDPDELFGAPAIETGWIHIQGAVANSVSTSIQDPSVYCVLVSRVSENRGAADLPFERGVRTNGELFPRTNSGDETDVSCP